MRKKRFTPLLHTRDGNTRQEDVGGLVHPAALLAGYEHAIFKKGSFASGSAIMFYCVLRPISRSWLMALLVASAGLVLSDWMSSPIAQADPIYRWVSPSGVISYGDQPPPDARKLQELPPALPPVPAPSQKRQPAPSPKPSTEGNKALTAMERLNLLTAINNYQRSLQPQPESRRHVYIPAYIGPGPYPFERPRRRHRPPPFHRRPLRPPANLPPTVLLPPAAPASAYSSPVLLP